MGGVWCVVSRHNTCRSMLGENDSWQRNREVRPRHSERSQEGGHRSICFALELLFDSELLCC